MNGLSAAKRRNHGTSTASSTQVTENRNKPSDQRVKLFPLAADSVSLLFLDVKNKTAPIEPTTRAEIFLRRQSNQEAQRRKYQPASFRQNRSPKTETEDRSNSGRSVFKSIAISRKCIGKNNSHASASHIAALELPECRFAIEKIGRAQIASEDEAINSIIRYGWPDLVQRKQQQVNHLAGSVKRTTRSATHGALLREVFAGTRQGRGGGVEREHGPGQTYGGQTGMHPPSR